MSALKKLSSESQLDEAWQALSLGRMNNAMAIIAMQWLFINKQALRARWSGGGEALGDE
jgi:hypothetical protein